MPTMVDVFAIKYAAFVTLDGGLGLYIWQTLVETTDLVHKGCVLTMCRWTGSSYVDTRDKRRQILLFQTTKLTIVT